MAIAKGNLGIGIAIDSDGCHETNALVDGISAHLHTGHNMAEKFAKG